MDSKSFWDSYAKISSKLKKRFMRKPNFAEGAADFEELKRLVRREGLPHYAAFCCLAIARCSQVLGEAQAEAAQHAEAATLFAQAERDIQQFTFSIDGSTIGFEENYTEATDCYQLAIQQYLKLGNAVMAIELCTELAGLVKLLGKHDEAMSFYQAAISLQTHYSVGLLQRLHSYEAILDCLYRQKYFRRAIAVLEELINLLSTERTARMPMANPHGDDLLAAKIMEAEVTRLLIMLLENCNREFIYREFSRLVGDSLEPGYFGLQTASSDSPDAGTPINMPGVLNSTICLSEHLADMLEALIESSLACDIKALVALDATLASSFTPTQRVLVGKLIEARQQLL